MTEIHPDLRRRIRRHLLAWYRRHRRDLPWRRTADPYRIWVAETMLQQTQVVRAASFYRRFLRRFPTMRALARAPLDDVLALWAGMGYYGRARNLHAAAGIVLARHAGRLPATVEALRALPGVGPYTAAAVASIVHGRPVPAVDGNVARVICRLFAIPHPPRTSAGRQAVEEVAAALISRRAPGNFNQATMDLGATVCTPRAPCCGRCPLERDCLARRRGLEGQLPARRPRRPIPHHDVVVAVIRRGRRLLLTKRPPHGLLGGLWELPGGKREPGEDDAAALRRELAEELGVRAAVGHRLAEVHHAYSHFRVTLHAYACRLLSGRPRPIGCEAVRWAAPDDVTRLALPAATRRILDRLSQTASA